MVAQGWLFFLLSGIGERMFSPAELLSSGTAMSENHITYEIASPPHLLKEKCCSSQRQILTGSVVSCTPLHLAVLLLVDHGLIISC